MASKIRIFVVDDHQLVRDGLLSLIGELDHSIEIVGSASNGKHALGQIEELEVKPDVVLVDINMPVMNGIEFTTELTKRYPDINVIALTMVKQSIHIKQMLKAGAVGYLLKDCDKSELEKAIKSVSEGKPYFAEEVSREVMLQMAGKTGQEYASDALTPREKEVLALIVKDMSNQQIADALHISVRTVDSHKQNLLGKTGANSMAGLVVYAIKNDLVDLDD